ncbi:MAG: hypothetical protein M0R06_02040 [Sphaerochaeta sp.]|jgi:hypothetical protein|nr:hypothetical protein [Sphaerochaeta sp.]
MNNFQKKAVINKLNEKRVIREMTMLPKLFCKRCNVEVSYCQRAVSTEICPWILCDPCIKAGIDAGIIKNPMYGIPF